MAIQIKSDGNFSIEYEGPLAGLDVQKPETLISDKASPSFNNFMLRNAEIRSRPNLSIFCGAQPFPVGISTFIDINGSYHTVLWSQNTLFQFNSALLPGNPWVLLGVSSPGVVNLPIAYRTFANTLYYTGSGVQSQHFGRPIITPFMGYWDGLTAAPVFTQTFSDASVSNSVAGISLTTSPAVGGSLPGNPVVTGPLDIGGAFIGELNNQLILANVSVKDEASGIIYPFPTLIWWSANGLPKQWDPQQNTSAGFNPFLDVSDQITGLVTMGVAGYVFRNFGITQFAPSGSSINPFTFDHMWASDHGIGNVLPWSVAQYGPTAGFISTDNIYSLSITNAEPIGGTARDAIMSDIANSQNPPFANVVPIFANGFVYLTYQLFIPFNNFVRNWVYSFEDKNWSAWDLNIFGNPPANPLTCVPNVV